MKTLSTLLAAALLLTAATAPAQDPKAGNPVMHSFGAIGAQAVFSTYMSIAELGDLVGAKTYDHDKAGQLANMYAKLSESAKDSLTDLIDSGKLNSDDEAAVREMVVINDLLVKTATGIVNYMKEPSDENEAAYNKSRQKAWKSISKFMGIEE